MRLNLFSVDSRIDELATENVNTKLRLNMRFSISSVEPINDKLVQRKRINKKKSIQLKITNSFQ